MRLRKIVGLLLVGFTLLGVTACGGEPAYKSSGVEVEGLVTLDGKPLEVGMVFAYPSSAMTKAEAASGRVEPDGRYTLSNVPDGAVRFAVRTSMMKGMAAAGKLPAVKAGVSGGPPTLAGKFVDVPKQYEDPDASKLTATVAPGKNTVNLELKSK
jgi:hypothetical protein